jgi:chemotaxis protein MotD
MSKPTGRSAADGAIAPKVGKSANLANGDRVEAKKDGAAETGSLREGAAEKNKDGGTDVGDVRKVVGATKAADAARLVNAGNEVDEPLSAEQPLSTEQPVSTEGRVRLSDGVSRPLKSSAEGAVRRGTDVANAEVKADKPEVKHGQNVHKDDTASLKQKAALSPSEELHALLGMAPEAEARDIEAADPAAEKPSSKASKHLDDDDKAADAQPVKEANTDSAAAAGIKADVPATQAAVAQHAAIKVADSAPAVADADNGKVAADSGTDKVQLVSDDGKSSPMDTELAKLGKHDGAEPQLNAKADFVAVLDSRRYLGFSTDGGNAAALASAIKAEPSWAQAMQSVSTGANHTATEVNTLKLQMNPEHLGNMTASLRLKGDALSVEVRVDTVDAYRQLSNDHDSLVKALKDQGFSIDQVTIQLSPSARTDAGQGSAGQNSGSQSQSGSSGQNLQQGGQGDNARQRDENARRNLNQNNWMGNDPTSTLSDSGIGSRTTDTGNLYL